MERVPWTWWLVIVLTLSVHLLFGAMPRKVRAWDATQAAASPDGSGDRTRAGQSIPLLQAAAILAVVAVAFGRRRAPSERTAVATIFAGATLMRLLLLDGEINGDEGVTFTEFIAPGIVTALAHYPAPNNHVLYSAIMALLYRLTESTLVLRLATALLSSLVVIGMHRLMQRSGFPMPERLLASLIVATATAAVPFAIQLRGYGPLLATVPFLLESYVVALSDATLKAWRRFALLGALACGLHLFGTFLVLALLAHGAILCSRRHVRPQHLLYAAAAFGACALALHALALPGMLDYFRHRSGAERYRGLDLRGTSALLFADGFASWPVIALCGAGVWIGIRSRRWTALWMSTVPPVLALSFCVGFRTFVFGRFFLFAFPGIVVLLASGTAFVAGLAADGRPRWRTSCEALGALAVLFLTSWNLPERYVTPTVAFQLTRVAHEIDPDSIYVAGRFHPLVRYYVGPCDAARTPDDLRAPKGRHIVVRDRRDHLTGGDLLERETLDAFLDEHYRVAWRPKRDPGNLNSALRGVEVLVPKESPAVPRSSR